MTKLDPEQIEAVAISLDYFEEWCAKTNTALSALGREVIQDQAALYRWRKDGTAGCSEAKRRALAIYVLEHPKGIPGYVRGKSGKRKTSTFSPGTRGNIPSSSRVGDLVTQGPSTELPVPGPDVIPPDDFAWVKKRAFARQCPIAVVLGELVEVGIRVERELEYEEAQEQEMNHATHN
jgi:hypothetical protein